jgi:hypothetical protein
MQIKFTGKKIQFVDGGTYSKKQVQETVKMAMCLASIISDPEYATPKIVVVVTDSGLKITPASFIIKQPILTDFLTYCADDIRAAA